MDIILLERIKNLGQMGDRVSVKSGYARNFLFPLKKALIEHPRLLRPPHIFLKLKKEWMWVF